MLIQWLHKELARHDWDHHTLARKIQLDQTFVKAILSHQMSPDIDFCLKVADVFNKQPERLLNMAGILSDQAFEFSHLMARGQLSISDIYRYSSIISIEERRLILLCAEQQGTLLNSHRLIRPTPQEFNTAERKQDRIRFAFIILTITGLCFAMPLILAIFLTN
ncbi:MAG: hypothetical protein AAF629_30655 [Chloroflexota bacterium]